MRTASKGDTKAATALKDRRVMTALMSAASAGHTKVIRTLLDNGADVNALTTYGETALMLAAMRGHTETARVLLINGADVNARDEKGRTALMYAEHLGHTDIVKLLKQTGFEE